MSIDIDAIREKEITREEVLELFEELDKKAFTMDIPVWIARVLNLLNFHTIPENRCSFAHIIEKLWLGNCGINVIKQVFDAAYEDYKHRRLRLHYKGEDY